jgi:thiol-disulfide isomerase/thioredoxin
MRRWGIVLLALAALGCNDKRPTPTVAGRFEAVKAAAPTASHWCDSAFTGVSPRLTLPPLAPGTAGPRALPKGKRVWLNLWATWCKPCLRELPLLLAWEKDLKKDGVDVEAVLLSVDEDGEALGKFLSERKDIPAAKVVRAASQKDYEDWVKAYVKDPSTPIPIHLLAASDGSVRCVRSGSLREGDYPAAKSVLR